MNIEESNKNIQRYKSSHYQPFLRSHTNQPLPEFLHSNLVDEARTIKLLPQNKQSFIRIFIYELLKHCFECGQPEQSHSHFNNFMDIFQENYHQVLLSQKCVEAGLTISHSKQILQQFLEMLSQSESSIEQKLSEYPIVFEIMKSFLLAFMSRKSFKASNSIFQTGEENANILILRKLCEMFGIDYALYEECFQFTISEHYVYLEDPQFLFLVYIDNQRAEHQSESLPSSYYEDSRSYQHSNSNGMKARKRETITFDRLQVLFDKTASENSNEGSRFRKTPKIHTDKQKEQPTADTNFRDKNSQLSSLLEEQEPQNEKQNSFVVCEQAKKYHKYSQSTPFKYRQFEVSKEFTDSKIIGILSEPFRSRIKEIKTKARADRNKNKEQECASHHSKRRSNIKTYF